MSGVKKLIFSAKDANTERKCKIKGKQILPEKGIFFGAPLFRQKKSNYLDFLNVHLITKYLLPEKISLRTLLQAEIKPLLFGKQPSLLRVKADYIIVEATMITMYANGRDIQLFNLDGKRHFEFVSPSYRE